MKNIVITPKIIKRELWVWLSMLVIAVLLNVYAIIKFNTEWIELISQIGYVLIISLVLYALLLLVRMLLKLFK